MTVFNLECYIHILVVVQYREAHCVLMTFEVDNLVIETLACITLYI